MPKFWKIIRRALYALFVLAFLFVSASLFFEKKTDNGNFQGTVGIKNTIGVVFPDMPPKLDPVMLDPAVRNSLINVYEPLVKTDRDLNFKPGLAMSWGLLDDFTWRFRLRPDVKFHDGSDFEVNDVLASFDRALYSPDSQIPGLDTIEKLEVIDELNFQVKTYEPDPLLLQKFSALLIFPSEESELDQLNLVGTGSYKFVSWDQEENLIILEAFPDYWGEPAKFKEAKLYMRISPVERLDVLFSGQADILSFVPYSADLNELTEKGFKLASVPSLEVQFIVFNFDSKYFAEQSAREVFSLAIDKQSLINDIAGRVSAAEQYVSSGVFGFNPEISGFDYDLEKAGELAKEIGLSGKTIQFHLMKGLEFLGEHVRTQLNKIGINVIVSYLENEDYWESIQNHKADLYFLAFKSDMGDSMDFLKSMAHKDGYYNFLNYENPLVDSLVESGLTDMDFESRRDSMQEVMKIIVDEDIIGVPIFEFETVFAFNDTILFEPRIDNMIYLDELTANK